MAYSASKSNIPTRSLAVPALSSGWQFPCKCISSCKAFAMKIIKCLSIDCMENLSVNLCLIHVAESNISMTTI